MRYMLDTNTCIYFLKGTYLSIHERLSSIDRHQVAIPAMVKAELLLGANKSRNREDTLFRLNEFLKHIEVIPFDDAACSVYADIRAFLELNGQPIGRNDLVIASTVIAHNGILVTNNTKEFSRIPKLYVEDWVISPS